MTVPEIRPSDTRDGAKTLVLAARNFSKTFVGRTVLRSVDLDIVAGEVHGLLGQNGSGKSTLIKILAGYHHPDGGASLVVRGRKASFPLAPGEPRRLGLSFVHQDLGLIEAGTVLENLRIGRYETGAAWRIPWRRERRAAREALVRFGLSNVDPGAPISSLRDVDRAMVAILRALEELRETPQGLLVLDEPTAYLPRDGVDRLFAAVREVAAMGFGVLFVTHRLEEVREITDSVSILRDGRLVESAPTASLTERELISRILGFSLDDLYPVAHEAHGDVVLLAREVSGAVVHDFSLDLHRGEIVGLTGLLGMGYEEVPYLLFGARTASSGSLELGGRSYDLRQLLPKQALTAGLALLPANRLRHGAVGVATIAENVTLPTLPSYLVGGRLSLGRELTTVQRLLGEFHVAPPEPARVFATLSGGNQQKALLAKWFGTNPSVFLLHEPTQGVDVGARRQIFQLIRDTAEQGTSFVLASSEYEDLAHLCDRVMVFRNGRVVSELFGSALTHERIVEQCFRNEGSAAGAAPPAPAAEPGERKDGEPER